MLCFKVNLSGSEGEIISPKGLIKSTRSRVQQLVLLFFFKDEDEAMERRRGELGRHMKKEKKIYFLLISFLKYLNFSLMPFNTS